MEYSDFGRKSVLCRKCGLLSTHSLASCKKPHFKAVVCEICQGWIEWLKRPLADEECNNFVLIEEICSLPDSQAQPPSFLFGGLK